MRRFLLIGCFTVLLAALAVLWHFRYERSAGSAVRTLADIRAVAPVIPGAVWSDDAGETKLTLRREAGAPPVSLRLPVPGASAVRGLHMRFKLSARGLKTGAEVWEDGRFVVEWHDPSTPGKWQTDYLASTRNDMSGKHEEFVIQPPQCQAVPALRIEHLGINGELFLTDVEITAVEESTAWKVGVWVLLAAWLSWILAFIHSWPGIVRWRAVLAGTIWLVACYACVLPGPWKLQRNMISTSFHIGAAATVNPLPPNYAQSTPVAMDSGTQKPLGKPPEPSNFMLRMKYRIANARLLLHMLMLAGPTFLMACLIGSRPAAWLCAILALGTELAESAFGYGFDSLDAADLVSDALGILVAVWLYCALASVLVRLRLEDQLSCFFHFPKRPAQPSRAASITKGNR